MDSAKLIHSYILNYLKILYILTLYKVISLIIFKYFMSSLLDIIIDQNAFAKAVSVSRQNINSKENGKFDPSLVLAMKLRRFFQDFIDEIFIYKD